MLSTTNLNPRPHIQEDIEWCDIWLPHLNAHALPRVLLIGDSITRAYYPHVEKALENKAYVGRIATSRSVGDVIFIKELDLVLSQNHFDVIHFNNGMHGWGYSEALYEQYFPELLDILRQHQPQSQLIWGSITPVREKDNLSHFEARTERVKARNAIAAELVQNQGIPINDLFQLGFDHPDYYSNDGVHFTPEGSAALATQVASAISAFLLHNSKA